MSIKINRESTNQEKIQTLNLVSIIEKYYLPKDIPSPESKNSKTQNLDTNLSDYLSLLSTHHQENINSNKIIQKNEIKKDIIITPKENNQLNKTNNSFSKIFRNYISPYFTLRDLISLKHTNKMFNILIDKKAINICTISNTIKKINSPELRAKIWYHYLNIKEFNKELFQKEERKLNNDKNEINSDKIEEIFYNKCLEIINTLKNDDKEKLLKIFSEEKISSMKVSLDFIVRDIDRTFHTYNIF